MQSDVKKPIISGEFFILSQAAINGLLPIIATYSTRIVQPVMFAGISALVAGISLLIYLLLTKEISELKSKKALPDILGVTIFIVIVPSIFLYMGASMTSSINVAILAQTELLFTWIICGLFFNETINLQKIAAALIVVIGATMVLYNGSFQLKIGDVLIIAAHVFYPIGNIFAKKALKITTPMAIVFYRNIIGGTVLVLLGLLFGKLGIGASIANIQITIILLLLVNGILLNVISKILWYKGLKKIEISKAVSIGMSLPAFSLIYAFLFLNEIPTVYQLTGFLIIILGLLTLTRKTIQNLGKVIVK